MEHNLIPQLRFAEFVDDWLSKKLETLGEYFGGGTPDTSVKYYWNGLIPWISSSDLIEGSIYVINKSRFITNEAISLSATKLVPKGSILMVSRVGIGKFAVADEDLCTSQDFTNLISTQNGYFLCYYFKARSNRFLRLSQGTSIKGFTIKDIKSAKFLIPSPPEQTKIAIFLMAIDKRIQILQKKKTDLEQYKKGVMQKLFSRSIRFKKDDGSNFPDWKEKKLRAVCEITKGKQLNKSELADIAIYPAINGGIGPSGYTENWNTLENTITISEGGNSCGYVNFIGTKFWSGGHCYSLLNLKDEMEKGYLYQSLKFNQNLIMRLRVGSGLPNIQKKDINNLKFLVPIKDEQKKIANFLISIDKSIDKIGAQIEDSIVFKQGLLQKMFV